MTASLNFAAQSVRAIRELALRPEWPDKSMMENVSGFIEGAVHFQLPDGGRIFDDGLRGIRNTVIRMPYRLMTVEYRVPVEMHKLTAASCTICTKRLALVLEMNSDETLEVMPNIPEHDRPAFDQGGIQIAVVSWLDDVNSWVLHPIGWAMPLRWDYFSPDRSGRPRIVGYPFPVLPERLRMMEGVGASRDGLISDIWDEVSAVLDFVEAAACSNVSSQSIQTVDERVNARRAREGKLPLYEVKVLTVDVLAKSSKGHNLGGHHAPPRMHLRRGHVRRLKDRTVWVNSAVVGDPKRGVVRKDYQFRRPNFGTSSEVGVGSEVPEDQGDGEAVPVLGQ